MNSLQNFLREKNLSAHILNRFVKFEKKGEKIKGSRKLENLILKCLGIYFLQKKIAIGLLDFYKLVVAPTNHQRCPPTRRGSTSASGQQTSIQGQPTARRGNK